jgi:hypothetical protein
MRESFEQSSPESDPRRAIDAFIEGFEGVSLKNSKGKEIALTVAHSENKKLFEDDEVSERVYVEFEGYEGHENLKDGNYLGFVILPAEKEINLSYIKLNDSDLRGENIYPQLVDLMGKHFPDDFRLTATIEHKRTQEKLFDLFSRFKNGDIDEGAVKAGIRRSGALRLIGGSGFNESKIVLNAFDEIALTSKKNPLLKEPTLTVGIEPPDKSPE